MNKKKEILERERMEGRKKEIMDERNNKEE
jgi:hypothetical protein